MEVSKVFYRYTNDEDYDDHNSPILACKIVFSNHFCFTFNQNFYPKLVLALKLLSDDQQFRFDMEDGYCLRYQGGRLFLEINSQHTTEIIKSIVMDLEINKEIFLSKLESIPLNVIEF